MLESRKEKLVRKLQARLGADGKAKNEYRESVANIRAELAMHEEALREAADASGKNAG